MNNNNILKSLDFNKIIEQISNCKKNKGGNMSYAFIYRGEYVHIIGDLKAGLLFSYLLSYIVLKNRYAERQYKDGKIIFTYYIGEFYPSVFWEVYRYEDNSKKEI